jgi:hypothetical protein
LYPFVIFKPIANIFLIIYLHYLPVKILPAEYLSFPASERKESDKKSSDQEHVQDLYNFP